MYIITLNIKESTAKYRSNNKLPFILLFSIVVYECNTTEILKKNLFVKLCL